MAALYNIDDSKLISIYLYKDITTDQWIKYQIVFEDKDSFKPEIAVFSEETAETDLFLESDIEPEIPQLVETVYSFLNLQICSFEFEPIDDKDFSLSAIHYGGEIKVELVLRYWGYDRKIILVTNHKKLLLFAQELQLEYEALIRGKHGLIKQ